MYKSKETIALFCSAAAAGLGLASPAHSQASATVDEAHSSEAMGGDEIVVTAQKRIERIQDIPFSVSAVSADTIRNQGVTNLLDLARTVPGLSFGNSQPGRETITIRGIYASSGDPTTGIYLDEYAIPGGQGADSFFGATDVDTSDLARIEVLRGPQGTLYGAGAMGGAIRYISPTPSLQDMTGDVTAGVSTTRYGGVNYKAGASMGAPIIEGKLGVRVSVHRDHRDGYIDRIDPNGTLLKKDANAGGSVGGRITLLWQPDDSFSVSPTLIYQKSQFDSEFNFSSDRPKYQKLARFDEPVEDSFFLAGLTINKDFGPVSLTSVTEYFERSVDLYQDYTDTNVNAIIGTVGGAARAAPFRNSQSPNAVTSRSELFSQELRLASTGNGPLSWVIGGYYADQKKTRVQDVTDVNFNAIAIATGATLRTTNNWIFYGSQNRQQKFYALFGDVAYTIVDGLKVSAGVRGFKMSSDLFRTQGGLQGGGALATLAPLNTTESGYNPKFSIDYKLSRSSMIYANAAKGFRAGGPISPLPQNNACISAALSSLGLSKGPEGYSSDSLWSYEVGTKNSLFGNKVRFNANAFYIDWSNIPQSVTLRDPATGQGCGYSITVNVGKASVRGAETEMSVELADNLTLSGNIGFTDSRADIAVASISATPGEQLQFVPKWTYAVSGEYVHDLGEDRAIALRMNYQYRSSARRSFDQASPYYYQQGYGVAGASATYTAGPWEAELYARNIFDSNPILNDGSWLSNTASFAGYGFRTTLTPRTVGANVRYRF
jgi:outer membrane receptor protein involved in Fe transport